jgi:hypothetical protein
MSQLRSITSIAVPRVVQYFLYGVSEEFAAEDVFGCFTADLSANSILFCAEILGFDNRRSGITATAVADPSLLFAVPSTPIEKFASFPGSSLSKLL